MRLVVENNYWSILINILLQKYFSPLTTTCILWTETFDFQLNTLSNSSTIFLQIHPKTLENSFEKDIYNFAKRQASDNEKGVFYNDLVKKLMMAIEERHCEGFVAFEEDIPKFAEAFQKASLYSIWRSNNLKFLFAYNKDKKQNYKDYVNNLLFKNQPYILVAEADSLNSSQFQLKTNKFVGPTKENPQELIHLSNFNALNHKFTPNIDLYSPSKLKNLQGREIVVGALDYRPFVAVDFERQPLYYDHNPNNPKQLVHVDGTEMRICHTFCELYNCTVQFDTTEQNEWGSSYENYTGYGLIGMIIDGRIQIAMAGIYTWYSDYIVLDFTTFLGRSGVTCLVPAPTHLTSWTLPLRPFQLTLWLAVLMCLVLETLALLIARQFEQFLMKYKSNWTSSIEFAYTTSLKLFISQSSHYRVTSHTVRVVLFACYMIDIIITSIYGGGLASTLTIPTLGDSADSVMGMYKHNLSWTATSLAWVESIMNDNNTIYSRLLENFELNTFEKMRSKAKTDNMGFAVERMMFGHFGNSEYFTPEALERLKLMVDDIYNNYAIAMVPRLWAHLPKYNDLILAWHSSGFDKFWEWKITADYLNVQQQNQVQASMFTNKDMGPLKLDLLNFAGLIAVWMLGMLLSIMVFIGEMLWHRISHKTQRRREILE